MTEEEKQKVLEFIGEHEKTLEEFSHLMGVHVDALRDMIKSNMKFNNVKSLGLFPFNFRTLDDEARKELSRKFIEMLNEALFTDHGKKADEKERTVDSILEDNGYGDSGIIVLRNESYDTALIGVTSDNRAVYSFSKMVDWYVTKNKCSEEDAIEWIECNTLRALPYMGEGAPIVIYGLD